MLLNRKCDEVVDFQSQMWKNTWTLWWFVISQAVNRLCKLVAYMWNYYWSRTCKLSLLRPVLLPILQCMIAEFATSCTGKHSTRTKAYDKVCKSTETERSTSAWMGCQTCVWLPWLASTASKWLLIDDLVCKNVPKQYKISRQAKPHTSSMALKNSTDENC